MHHNAIGIWVLNSVKSVFQGKAIYVSFSIKVNLSAIQCNWQCPRVLKSVLQGRAYRALLWPLRRVAIVGSAYCTTDHGSGASPHPPTPYLPNYPPSHLRLAQTYLQMHINIQSNLQTFHNKYLTNVDMITDHSRGA